MKDQHKPKMNTTIQNLNTKNIRGVEKKNSLNLLGDISSDVFVRLTMFRRRHSSSDLTFWF